MLGATAMSFLACASLLVLVPVVKSQETTSCYGNGIHKVIGGDRETIDRTFDCHTCIEQQLCISDGYCFVATSTSVHVFRNGLLSQPPVPIDSRCNPLRMFESTVDPGYVILVQCQSHGSQFRPAIQYIELNDEETAFETRRFIQSTNLDNNYAQNLDNYVIVPGSYRARDYVVAMFDTPSGNKVLVHSTTNFQVGITGCDSIERLHRGPASNDKLQFIVDCLQQDGQHIRLRVLVSEDDISSSPDITTLVPPVGNDTTSYSPAGSYITYTAMSQVVVIKTSMLTATPGILNFEGPVAQAEFLNDGTLLVSIPGLDRTLVDLEEFFSSDFSRGVYQLSDSAASCPSGDCSPFTLKDSYLYILAIDETNSAYHTLQRYNLDDLNLGPSQIGKTLSTDVFDICFVSGTPALIVPTPPSSISPVWTSLVASTSTVSTDGSSTTTSLQPSPSPSPTQATPTSTTSIQPPSTEGLSTPSPGNEIGTLETVVGVLGSLGVFGFIVLIIIVGIVLKKRDCFSGTHSGIENQVPNPTIVVAVPNEGVAEQESHPPPPIPAKGTDKGTFALNIELSDYGSGSNRSSQTNITADLPSSGFVSLNGTPPRGDGFPESHELVTLNLPNSVQAIENP